MSLLFILEMTKSPVGNYQILTRLHFLFTAQFFFQAQGPERAGAGGRDHDPSAGATAGGWKNLTGVFVSVEV